MSDKLQVGDYQAKTHLPDLLRKVRAGLRFGHAMHRAGERLMR